MAGANELLAKNFHMDQELLKTNLTGLERKILVLINEHKSTKRRAESPEKENQDLKERVSGSRRTDLRFS